MNTDVSSKLKYKKHSPDYQQSLISRENDKNFARVFSSLIYDERFLSLSAMARIVYIAMIIECGKDGSRTKCTFPKSAYIRLCSKPTFIKCKRELIENGFIKEIAFRTRSNIYKLCGNWKLDVIPKGEPEYHDVSEYEKLK